MRNDNFYFFTVGFCLAMVVAGIVFVSMPASKPDFTCGGCNSPDWYSMPAGDIAEGGE